MNPNPTPRPEAEPRCNFCCRYHAEVSWLVASEITGVMICDSCADFASQMMKAADEDEPANTYPEPEDAAVWREFGQMEPTI